MRIKLQCYSRYNRNLSTMELPSNESQGLRKRIERWVERNIYSWNPSHIRLSDIENGSQFTEGKAILRETLENRQLQTDVYTNSRNFRYVVGAVLVLLLGFIGAFYSGFEGAINEVMLKYVLSSEAGSKWFLGLVLFYALIILVVVLMLCLYLLAQLIATFWQMFKVRRALSENF